MVVDIVLAVVADAMSAYGLPASGTSGVAGLAVWRKLSASRVEAAREILVEELKRGQKTAFEVPEDELAAVTFRYARAAVEGSARLNLRLLAAVAAGQLEGPGLYADDFLRHADVLASLRREEVLLLGEFLHVAKSAHTDVATSNEVWQVVKGRMNDNHGLNEVQARALAVSCMRTGYLSQEAGTWVEPMLPVLTDSLVALNSLADIEGVIMRHKANQPDEGKRQKH